MLNKEYGFCNIGVIESQVLHVSHDNTALSYEMNKLL